MVRYSPEDLMDSETLKITDIGSKPYAVRERVVLPPPVVGEEPEPEHPDFTKSESWLSSVVTEK